MTGKILRGLAILTAGTLAIFAASPAYSADLGGAKVPMPAAVPILASPSWEGWYLGGNLGAMAGGDNDLAGGVHLGHNWQNGQFVYGAEGDVSVSGDNFGSIRGRLGFAGNSWLVYGTVGLAVDDDSEGLVAGGGLEYKVAGNVSIGAEALYYDLDDDFTFIRGRVSWRFGGTHY